MTTVEVKLYQYDELGEAAKEKARQWFAEGVFDFEWWECTYDDAASVGVKITSFDLDRNRHAKGALTMDAVDVIAAILEQHGPGGETHKTAKAAKAEYDAIPESEDEDGEKEKDADAVSAWEAEFTRAILEDYSILLQQEADGMTSDEYLEDGIIANEYTFTEDGRRFG